MKPRPKWVLAPNPSPMTLDGTRTYIVGDARPVVIDPGPSIEAHTQAVLQALGGARPVALVLTHAHADHSGGAAELARRTGAPIWMAAGTLQPGIPPLDHTARRGDILETDSGVLRVLLTPGHAPEHICLSWTDGSGRSAGIFVGDLFMGVGDTTLVAPPEGDLTAYLASLDHIQRLGPTTLYPAHGPPLLDSIGAVERYRRHRQQRIEQVRELLRLRGPHDPEEVIDAVYGSDLDPRLRPAAMGSIRAILAHITREG